MAVLCPGARYPRQVIATPQMGGRGTWTIRWAATGGNCYPPTALAPCAAMVPLVTRRLKALLLPALLVVQFLFGVRAIVQDRHPTFSDSILPDSVVLYEAITTTKVTAGDWLEATNYRPPLSYLPGLVFYFMDRPGLAVLRFSVLVQFLFGLWLVASIGRIMAGPRAGLLAAVVVGTLPMVYGWGRMAYMDMPLAVTVLLCLRLLFTCDFNTFKSGAFLGVGVGLGLLAKVAFPIFALAPVGWTVALRIRSRRNLAVLGVVVAVALVVASWWYIPQWEPVVTNVGMSQATEVERNMDWLTTKLSAYFFEVPAGGWLLISGLLLGLAALALNTVRRDHQALLLLSSVVPIVVLVFFQHLRRYALPVYPLLGLLLAVSLDSLAVRLAPKLASTVAALVSAVCLAEFLLINLGTLPVTTPPGVYYHIAGPRVDGLGLITPDHRSYSEYNDALVQAREAGLKKCMVIYDAEESMERHGGLQQQLEVEQGSPPLELVYHHSAFVDAPSDSPCLLVITDQRGTYHWKKRGVQFEESVRQICLDYAWFRALSDEGAPALKVRRGPSPLHLTYSVYALSREAIDQIKRPTTAPYCKLHAVFWDSKLK